MKTFEFGDFSFNSCTLELHLGGEDVVLRPKTAALLRVLLNSHPKLLSKREIIKAVWQSEWVSEQNLFQAMSELRRALAPLKPIKTFPNKGYQWVLPVHSSEFAAAQLCTSASLGSPRASAITNPQHWQRFTLAACVSAVILFAGVMIGVSYQPASKALAASQVNGLSPALIAFASGLAKLDVGQVAQAERYFRLSVDENPEFLEAQLLLSETMLRQGRVDDARQRALQLVNRQNAHQDTYTVIAAMDLISRSDQVAGQSSSAMEWAMAAADQAHTEGFICAAANLDQRLSTLVAVAAADVTASRQSVLPFDEDIATGTMRENRLDLPLQKTVSTSIDLSSPLRCEQIRAPISKAGDRAALSGNRMMSAGTSCAPEHMDGFLVLINFASRPADKHHNSLV